MKDYLIIISDDTKELERFEFDTLASALVAFIPYVELYKDDMPQYMRVELRKRWELDPEYSDDTTARLLSIYRWCNSTRLDASNFELNL